MSSDISGLTLDEYKSWVNPSVNNLKVYGAINMVPQSGTGTSTATSTLGGLVLVGSGVSGYVPTGVNYFEQFDWAQFDTTSSATWTVSFSRIGNSCSAFLQGQTGFTMANAAFTLASVPARFQPLSGAQPKEYCNIVNNSTVTIGLASLSNQLVVGVGSLQAAFTNASGGINSFTLGPYKTNI
jgi:hypothetical protein